MLYISKLSFKKNQVLHIIQHYDYLQTDLKLRYICVGDEKRQLQQDITMCSHPNKMAAIDLLTCVVQLPVAKHYRQDSAHHPNIHQSQKQCHILSGFP